MGALDGAAMGAPVGATVADAENAMLKFVPIATFVVASHSITEILACAATSHVMSIDDDAKSALHTTTLPALPNVVAIPATPHVAAVLLDAPVVQHSRLFTALLVTLSGWPGCNVGLLPPFAVDTYAPGPIAIAVTSNVPPTAPDAPSHSINESLVVVSVLHTISTANPKLDGEHTVVAKLPNAVAVPGLTSHVAAATVAPPVVQHT